MSILVGPAAGALVAGGIYYGFSSMMQSWTERHRSDLHTLSQRLLEAPSQVNAPPAASERITHHPFSSMLKGEWNAQVATLFRNVGEWNRRATEWGRRTLYGGESRRT
ncbi:hypothetical protein BKA93DRAFT_732580 [Sparassis latifolia]